MKIVLLACLVWLPVMSCQCHFKPGVMPLADKWHKFHNIHSKEVCADKCLHLRETNPKIDSVGYIQKSGDCFCEENTKNMKKDRRYSACRITTQPREDCVETNVGSPGNDLESHSGVESWKICEDLCKSLSGCKAWTYLTSRVPWLSERKKCHLKSKIGKKEPAIGKLTGSLECKFQNVNWALGKPSTQSSTYGNGNRPDCDAKWANDGSMDTVSTTQDDAGAAWWQVDLQRLIAIKDVTLRFNEYPLKVDYYKDVVILTKTSEKGTWTVCKEAGHLTSTPVVIKCDRPTNAQFVRLALKSKTRLYLGELEVHGSPV